MNNSDLYKTERIRSKFKKIYEIFENYSSIMQKSIFLIDKILGQEDKPEIARERNFAVVAISGYKVILIMKNPSESTIYKEDFIDDIDHLSKVYNYIKVIGRKREWEDLFMIKYETDFDTVVDEKSFEMLFNDCKVNESKRRTSDLIISLIINSINDIDAVAMKEKPKDLLEEVKHKIILHDTKQSEFIFDTNANSPIYLQGLAGTGKTELLLRKMKEKYVENKDNIISFVCYNTALANDIKKRIPNFFNLLKVTEQIEWNKRLFVFNSWGSKDNYDNTNRGLYGYICNYYDVQFIRYEHGVTFDEVCKQAIKDVKTSDRFLSGEKPFDYIFIDESQDFNSSFMELCQMVARIQVCIAGDIFQNIFDNLKENEISPDYILNRCYRTDSRTLMFAHSIGLGLQEKEVLNWLTDDEWTSFGYDFEIKDNRYTFSRKTIRRFGGDENYVLDKSIDYKLVNEDSIISGVINIISGLRKKYSGIKPNDVGIVILGDGSKIYNLIDNLSNILKNEFQWESSIGYLTKERRENAVYISNKNNVKGLEFPFIICIIADEIRDTMTYRNSLYMILTRSFLTSYIILEDNSHNNNIINSYDNELDELNRKKTMTIEKPSDNDIKSHTKILNSDSLKINYTEEIDNILEGYDDINEDIKDTIRNMTIQKYNNNASISDLENIKDFIGDLIQVYNNY